MRRSWRLARACARRCSPQRPGRELAERGWEDDVDNCAALDVTGLAAVLDGDAFRALTL